MTSFPPVNNSGFVTNSPPRMGSLKGVKLCVPTPSQMMLFFPDPWNSTIPSSGLVHRMPSLLSAFHNMNYAACT